MGWIIWGPENGLFGPLGDELGRTPDRGTLRDGILPVNSCPPPCGRESSGFFRGCFRKRRRAFGTPAAFFGLFFSSVEWKFLFQCFSAAPLRPLGLGLGFQLPHKHGPTRSVVALRWFGVAVGGAGHAARCRPGVACDTRVSSHQRQLSGPVIPF